MNDQFDESANGRARYVEAASKATIEPEQELELEQERRWAQVVARAWDDEDFWPNRLTCCARRASTCPMTPKSTLLIESLMRRPKELLVFGCQPGPMRMT